MLNQEDFEFNQPYVVILGATVSTTARSPKIWNHVLESMGKNVRMWPIDVGSEHIEPLMKLLSADQNCLGGAVAVPYKLPVAKFLTGQLDKVADLCGAVNCFYRSSGSQFVGTNTDGLAALTAIESALHVPLKGRVLVLGNGGVARAIIAALLTSGYRVDVSARTSVAITGIQNHFTFEREGCNLFSYDLVINATTLGSAPNHLENSPLSDIELKQLNKSCKVFDVVYVPEKPKLSHLAEVVGLSYLNGLLMNKLQAEIAINKCFPDLNESNVSSLIRDL